MEKPHIETWKLSVYRKLRIYHAGIATTVLFPKQLADMGFLLVPLAQIIGPSHQNRWSDGPVRWGPVVPWSRGPVWPRASSPAWFRLGVPGSRIGGPGAPFGVPAWSRGPVGPVVPSGLSLSLALSVLFGVHAPVSLCRSLGVRSRIGGPGAPFGVPAWSRGPGLAWGGCPRIQDRWPGGPVRCARVVLWSRWSRGPVWPLSL